MTTTTNAGAIVIRRATDTDIPTLADLATLDSREPLTGPALIAELDGIARAALDLHDGSVAADPFAPTAELVELLRLHAGSTRTASHTARGSVRGRRRLVHATGLRPCIRPRSRRSPRGGPMLPRGRRPRATRCPPVHRRARRCGLPRRFAPACAAPSPRGARARRRAAHDEIGASHRRASPGRTASARSTSGATRSTASCVARRGLHAADHAARVGDGARASPRARRVVHEVAAGPRRRARGRAAGRRRSRRAHRRARRRARDRHRQGAGRARARRRRPPARRGRRDPDDAQRRGDDGGPPPRRRRRRLAARRAARRSSSTTRR